MYSSTLNTQHSKLKTQNSKPEASKPLNFSVMHNPLALRVVSGNHIKGAAPSKEKDRFPGLFSQ